MRDQHYKSLLNSHDPSLQWSIDLEYHHNQHHDSSREGSVGLMVGMPTWELRRWRQAWVGRQNLSTYDLLVMWGDEEDGDDDGDDGDGDGENQWNMMITKNFQCIYHLLCLNNFLNLLSAHTAIYKVKGIWSTRERCHHRGYDISAGGILANVSIGCLAIGDRYLPPHLTIAFARWRMMRISGKLGKTLRRKYKVFLNATKWRAAIWLL